MGKNPSRPEALSPCITPGTTKGFPPGALATGTGRVTLPGNPRGQPGFPKGLKTGPNPSQTRPFKRTSLNPESPLSPPIRQTRKGPGIPSPNQGCLPLKNKGVPSDGVFCGHARDDPGTRAGSTSVRQLGSRSIDIVLSESNRDIQVIRAGGRANENKTRPLIGLRRVKL